MSNIKGRFYFKQTNNGNLIGEYSNNMSTGISTESADLITNVNSEKYIGEYKTTWREDDTPNFADLNIIFKKNTNDRIYTLKWIDKSKMIFEGEGMLCDNILIGDYWDL